MQREMFMAMVESWLPDVYAYFRRLGVESAAAEDLAQSTFVTAWQNIARLRDPERLQGWLYGIAYRQYLRHRDHGRADARAIGEAGARMEQTDPAAASNPGSDRRLAAQSVREAVGRLPEKYRQPLVLLFWEGLSYQQAAKVLSLPLGTLAWRVHAALKLLKQALAEGET